MAATTPAAPSMAPMLTAFMPAAFGATAEVAAAAAEEAPEVMSATLEDASEETDWTAEETEARAPEEESVVVAAAEDSDEAAVVSAAAEEDSPPAESGLASTKVQRALVASRTAKWMLVLHYLCIKRERERERRKRTSSLSSASLNDLWASSDDKLLLLWATLASVVGETAANGGSSLVKGWLCASWNGSNELGSRLGGDSGDESEDDSGVLHICGIGLLFGLVERY